MQDLYISNLPYDLNEPEIQTLFSPFGEVGKVTLIIDHHSGRKKGYGFVKISDEGVNDAIDALNLSQCHGRTIKVSVAPNR